MAVSRDTGHRPTGRFWERVFGQLTRHDLVLTAIPLVFVLAVLANTVLSVPFLAAIAASAVLGVGILVDALFINPPVDTGPNR